ncbi:P-loop containing nucleoside triphosphate hydrolase protein [Athelia psychrophila]|uniref:RNA helicase n=1 Tax=Athelia psychrophila TaxID=1759441 RepID=A0A166AGC4_9AGAM|nr:P-loop containing nucleoside triphosphate hydrolase protein [Fibularhizoctonia sp. CBS 109695]
MPKIVWTEDNIRELVSKHFGKRACWFQIRVALALHAGNDVVGKAPTGMGKTLSFFIALLMALAENPESNARIIIVTPLNLLGKQNVEMLEAADLKAMAISAENDDDSTFEGIFAYRVIVVNPEILMDSNGRFTKLWKKAEFTRSILHFVLDEAHL